MKAKKTKQKKIESPGVLIDFVAALFELLNEDLSRLKRVYYPELTDTDRNTASNILPFFCRKLMEKQKDFDESEKYP